MNEKQPVIGYTTGVYDLFHIGHLNLFKNAKGMCDRLIVGVTVDELVEYKGKKAMIPFEDRIEIVRSCRYVDAAVPQYDMDKLTAARKLGAFCRRRLVRHRKVEKIRARICGIRDKDNLFPVHKGNIIDKDHRGAEQRAP